MVRRGASGRSGPRPLSDYDRHAGRVIAEKLEVLRLLRALDLAGVDPGATEALAEPLVELAEYDAMLASVLDGLDRLGRKPGPPQGGATFGRLVDIGEEIRARVLEALPADQRLAALESLDRVGVSEAEVWLEIERLRALPPVKGDAEPLPETKEERVRRAREFYKEGFRVEPDERVARQEAKPLPRATRIEPWLERMPVGWLRTMARLYDIVEKPPKAELVRRVAAELRSPEKLGEVLRHRLGAMERWLLARLNRACWVPLSEMPPDLRNSFDVTWDWRGGIMPGSGAKLRTYGLAFVGRVDGERSISYPEEMEERVYEALREVAPDDVAEVEAEGMLLDALESELEPPAPPP